MTKETQYLVVHQTRDHEPTDYENLLGDGLEQAFARGLQEPAEIVQALNAACVPSPGGKPWTEDLFFSELKRLGA